jgi:glyoxylase-like metal-dependent hydrolase (beta-lactamase superfamily II)
VDFKIVQISAPFYEATNVIRIGDTIIDTGHVDDASTSVLLQQLENGDLRGVGEVVITHPHIDHVGARAGLPKIGEMPHIILRGAEEALCRRR